MTKQLVLAVRMQSNSDVNPGGVANLPFSGSRFENIFILILQVITLSVSMCVEFVVTTGQSCLIHEGNNESLQETAFSDVGLLLKVNYFRYNS